jgi:hypothetical protein
MATTALYHRKALPRKKAPAWAALDQRARQIVYVSNVLLCLAEHLDRGHAGFVQDACLRREETQCVRLYIDAARDYHVEVWGVQKHLARCERVFGRPCVIKTR